VPLLIEKGVPHRGFRSNRMLTKGSRSVLLSRPGKKKDFPAWLRFLSLGLRSLAGEKKKKKRRLTALFTCALCLAFSIEERNDLGTVISVGHGKWSQEKGQVTQRKKNRR